jgi:hypothetical protein
MESQIHRNYHHLKSDEADLKIPIQFNIYATIAPKANNSKQQQQAVSFTLNLHYTTSLLISEKIIKAIVKRSVIQVLHNRGYIVLLIHVTPCYQAFTTFEEATRQTIEKKMDFFIPIDVVHKQHGGKNDHELQTQAFYNSKK